eukprot:1993095-Amphidinium_carterae.1
MPWRTAHVNTNLDLYRTKAVQKPVWFNTVSGQFQVKRIWDFVDFSDIQKEILNEIVLAVIVVQAILLVGGLLSFLLVIFMASTSDTVHHTP